jgi:hypothetical protein
LGTIPYRQFSLWTGETYKSDHRKIIFMNTSNLRTTVSIKRTTKARMDKWRATGQCYDGFLCQMIGLWEQMHKEGRKHNSEI